MIRITITIAVVLLLSCQLKAQICLFEALDVEINDIQQPEIFDENTSIEFFDEYILIGEDTLIVINLVTDYFADRATLVEKLNCAFPKIGDFNIDISGHLLTYEVNTTHQNHPITKIRFFTFEDYHRNFNFVVLNEDIIYEFTNIQSYLTKAADYFYIPNETEYSVNYVFPDQIDGAIEIIQPIEYEVVTEQVLDTVTYDTLSVNPAQFINTYNYYQTESSTCPEAQFEPQDLQILVKDAYSAIQVTQPTFETVSEQVLVSWGFDGPHYYNRSLINLDTITEIYAYAIQIDSLYPACCSFNFLRAITYEQLVDSTIEHTTIGVVYPACREGYQSAGTYCFTQDGEIPSTYETRKYTRISTPPGTIITNIPAEYKTITVQKISNPHELHDSCIVIKTDSVAYAKAIAPVQTISHQVPATYNTRIFEKVLSPAIFTTIESQEEVNTIWITKDNPIVKINGSADLPKHNFTCIHEAIKERLVELGEMEEDVQAESKAYFQALIDFQIKQELKIGVIDRPLLNLLNVEF